MGQGESWRPRSHAARHTSRYFNKSDMPCRALFWVSPMQKLEALFNQLHNLTDPAEVVRISAQHEVDFLPPEAND
jgi:hypothetical protein